MIIILGAGIIGLSIGYDLLKKGKKLKSLTQVLLKPNPLMLQLEC